MDITTVMAEFVIRGDKFDPHTITDALKISPTKYWTKEIDKRPEDPPPPNPENLMRIKDPELKVMFQNINDKLMASGKNLKQKKHHFSLWSVDTGYQESNNIDVQTNQIYRLFKDKVSVLKKLKTKMDLYYTFGIVVKIEDNEKPAIGFDIPIIDFCHEIRATISVDQYIYS